MKVDGWGSLDRDILTAMRTGPSCNSVFLVLTGIKLEEIKPCKQDNEVWRGIRVTFPENITTYFTIQDFYFGEDHLLRRHDYIVDVVGTFNAAQYVSDYIEADGIKPFVV